MPFKSKAQQRMMFATNPRMAREMASKTKSMKSLPARAAKKTARKASKKGGKR
jgi:hypothetical protein